MARTRQHKPLLVFLDSDLVGQLLKEPSGAIYFQYDQKWADSKPAIPVSHSLPLREDPYKGDQVAAVFENLLPDSEKLRQRIAERVSAKGTDAYSLLLKIGRDCVGALQFVPEGEEIARSPKITGEVISDEEIEKLLNNLTKAPLGLDRDEEFRISVAGAQEKTSLLRHNGKWLKPHDTTPTTHILKTQIGSLPEGVDLSNSVENEYYCLKLIAAFGLPVNEAEIATFGRTKALVIKRFDRTWTNDKRLFRLPQEDLCQALSFPPTQKYQSDGGPGMVEILELLKASDTPFEDSKTFLKTQILFWLMGATDGHAKNFSIFLGERGAFHMTPIYDVLTAQPSVDDRELERKRMKLAMFVGNSRHYKIDEIMGRHFIQTTERAGLPGLIAKEALAEIANAAPQAIDKVEKQLPAEFPQEIHDSVKQGLKERLQRI